MPRRLQAGRPGGRPLLRGPALPAVCGDTPSGSTIARNAAWPCNWHRVNPHRAYRGTGGGTGVYRRGVKGLLRPFGAVMRDQGALVLKGVGHQDTIAESVVLSSLGTLVWGENVESTCQRLYGNTLDKDRKQDHTKRHGQNERMVRNG